MKKILILIIISILICSTNFVVVASENDDNTVLFNSASNLIEWDANRYYNVSISKDIAKSEDGSLRVDTIFTQVLTDLNTISINAKGLSGDIYLEFWLYVINNEDISEVVGSSIQLSSSSNCTTDLFYWDMEKYTYLKGWNRISLALNDAAIVGTPDLSKIKSFKFHSFVRDKVTIYLDELVLTNTPIAIKDTDLGLEQVEEKYTINSEANNTNEVCFMLTMINTFGIFDLIAGFCLVTVIIFIILKRSKKNA